eukprot:5432001-Prymnesium_polylepis.2
MSRSCLCASSGMRRDVSGMSTYPLGQLRRLGWRRFPPARRTSRRYVPPVRAAYCADPERAPSRTCSDGRWGTPWHHATQVASIFLT